MGWPLEHVVLQNTETKGAQRAPSDSSLGADQAATAVLGSRAPLAYKPA